jgi:hypothetical protein
VVLAPDDPGRSFGTAPGADEAAPGEYERPARPAQRAARPGQRHGGPDGSQLASRRLTGAVAGRGHQPAVQGGRELPSPPGSVRVSDEQARVAAVKVGEHVGRQWPEAPDGQRGERHRGHPAGQRPADRPGPGSRPQERTGPGRRSACRAGAAAAGSSPRLARPWPRHTRPSRRRRARPCTRRPPPDEGERYRRASRARAAASPPLRRVPPATRRKALRRTLPRPRCYSRVTPVSRVGVTRPFVRS